MNNIHGVVVGVKDFNKELSKKLLETYKAPTIQVTNSEAKGLCAKYNLVINSRIDFERTDVENSWLVFTHDDVTLLSSLDNLRNQLESMKQKGAAIVAVAGSTNLPPINPGHWWYGLMTSEFRGSGAVVHKTPGSDEMQHIESYGPYPQQVAAIDGLWFAVRTKYFKDKKLRFDEKTFDGYHYYDADFCATARSLGYKIWVAGILVSHDVWGRGIEDPKFKKYQKRFFKKWKKRSKEYKRFDKVVVKNKFIDNTSAYESPNGPQSYTDEC
jgi:GT2 family glycosyltransferase